MLAFSALGLLALSQAFKSRALTRPEGDEKRERGSFGTPDRPESVVLRPLDVPTLVPPILEGAQRRAVSTELTRAQARNLLAHTFAELEGRPPTVDELDMLAAHSDLETGAWRSMWNWNAGNVTSSTSSPHYVLKRVLEYVDGEPVKMDVTFRSYDDARAGFRSFVSLVRRRYPRAWALLGSRDSDAYAAALKAGGYYSAPLARYQRVLRERYA
jgi:hypothetical protein